MVTRSGVVTGLRAGSWAWHRLGRAVGLEWLGRPGLGADGVWALMGLGLGSLGKNTISPVPSAHVRIMRKGSTDHLALYIDSKSDRLINSEETDENKGHLFKSLNTSGLLLKQGNLIADRVDGIWVFGG
ncbi:hypothetical protein CRYUN_Cryun04dG0153800 [Craigia yunnanensis]